MAAYPKQHDSWCECNKIPSSPLEFRSNMRQTYKEAKCSMNILKSIRTWKGKNPSYRKNSIYSTSTTLMSHLLFSSQDSGHCTFVEVSNCKSQREWCDDGRKQYSKYNWWIKVLFYKTLLNWECCNNKCKFSLCSLYFEKYLGSRR